MRRLHVDLRAWAGLSRVGTGRDDKGWSPFREMVFACGDDWMQSQPHVLSVCISLKLEATLGVWNQLSDRVMRVNRCLTFWSRGLQTWAVWQWQPAREKIRITITVSLTPANTSTFGAPGRHFHRLKHVQNPLSLIFNSCVHREKCLGELRKSWWV